MIHIDARLLILVMALVTLTACGGAGDGAEVADDSRAASTTEGTDSTTSTAVPASSTTPAAGADGANFCETLAADVSALEFVDVSDPEALEEQSREGLATMEDLRGRVPPELEDPYDTLLEGNRSWFALLEEYKWDIVAIPVDEPRMLGMTSDERSEASEAILEYCDLDFAAEGSSGGA